MPAYNGMGPQGAGPMTGWGRGYCMTFLNRGAGFVPGYGRGSRCSAGFGRPGGRGRRNCFYATGLPRWARLKTIIITFLLTLSLIDLPALRISKRMVIMKNNLARLCSSGSFRGDRNGI
jgi:hypothetical protein